ncbi:hypothetical protein, partial [Leuconostoc citreum]
MIKSGLKFKRELLSFLSKGRKMEKSQGVKKLYKSGKFLVFGMLFGFFLLFNNDHQVNADTVSNSVSKSDKNYNVNSANSANLNEKTVEQQKTHISSEITVRKEERNKKSLDSDKLDQEKGNAHSSSAAILSKADVISADIENEKQKEDSTQNNLKITDKQEDSDSNYNRVSAVQNTKNDNSQKKNSFQNNEIKKAKITVSERDIDA